MWSRAAGAMALMGRYEPETESLLARMSVQPSGARAGTIDALIVRLKEAGVWTRLDGLYVMAAHTAQASLLNWVAVDSLTNAGPLPFTADVGYVGDATNVLASGVAPTWSNTDHHAGTYTSAYSSQGGSTGVVSGAGGNVRLINTNGIGSMTALSAATAQDGGVPGPGHVALSRSTNTGYDVFREGVVSYSPVQATGAFAGGGVNFLSLTTSGVTLRAGHFGISLTAPQMLALRNALAAYMAGL